MKVIKELDLIVVTYWVIFLTLIVIAFFFALSGDKYKAVNSIGAFMSAYAACLGIPFIVRNFSIQSKTYKKLQEQKLDSDMEREFSELCKSIDIGLSYVRNTSGTMEGGSAIIKYGDQCLSTPSAVNIDVVIKELGINAIKSIASGLFQLADWTLTDERHFKYYPFYRVRYMPIILSFEKMMPDSNFLSMTQSDLIKTYAVDDPDKYSFILSVWHLSKRDFDLWTEYEMHKEELKKIDKDVQKTS